MVWLFQGIPQSTHRPYYSPCHYKKTFKWTLQKNFNLCKAKFNREKKIIQDSWIVPLIVQERFYIFNRMKRIHMPHIRYLRFNYFSNYKYCLTYETIRIFCSNYPKLMIRNFISILQFILDFIFKTVFTVVIV